MSLPILNSQARQLKKLEKTLANVVNHCYNRGCRDPKLFTHWPNGWKSANNPYAETHAQMTKCLKQMRALNEDLSKVYLDAEQAETARTRFELVQHTLVAFVERGEQDIGFLDQMILDLQPLDPKQPLAATSNVVVESIMELKVMWEGVGKRLFAENNFTSLQKATLAANARRSMLQAGRGRNARLSYTASTRRGPTSTSGSSVSKSIRKRCEILEMLLSKLRGLGVRG